MVLGVALGRLPFFPAPPLVAFLLPLPPVELPARGKGGFVELGGGGGVFLPPFFVVVWGVSKEETFFFFLSSSFSSTFLRLLVVQPPIHGGLDGFEFHVQFV